MHRIETTYTEDDLVNFTCFTIFRLDAFRKMIRRNQLLYVLIIVVFLGIIIVQPNVVEYLKSGSGIFCLFFLFLSLFMALAHPRRFRRHQRECSRKILRETHSDLIGTPLTVELREDGVFSQNVRGQSTYVYPAIREIVEHAACVYVCFAKAEAFIFPRDRIPCETLDAFIAELKTRVSQRSPHAPETN